MAKSGLGVVSHLHLSHALAGCWFQRLAEQERLLCTVDEWQNDHITIGLWPPIAIEANGTDWCRGHRKRATREWVDSTNAANDYHPLLPMKLIHGITIMATTVSTKSVSSITKLWHHNHLNTRYPRLTNCGSHSDCRLPSTSRALIICPGHWVSAAAQPPSAFQRDSWHPLVGD